MAKTQTQPKRKNGFSRIMRGFRPAVPATVGTAALTFLFAAFMPLEWVAGLCWNLYLDAIHPVFAAPVGNGARLVIALFVALAAALVALIVALAIAKPAVKGNRVMNERVANRARQNVDEPADLLRRRRVDTHPDAPPVAPINAGRDLPVGGLGPFLSATDGSDSDGSDDDMFDLTADQQVSDDDMLDLDAFAANHPTNNTAPFHASASIPNAALPDDGSLGSMVARLEAGLGRRRQNPSADPAPSPNVHAAGFDNDDPTVDLALEAALSTLQRMSRSAVG